MGESSKILVAEDQENVRALLCALMRAEGMTPLEAGNGMEALARIQAECPAVALLDIRMPVMDGMQVLNEVRKSNLSIPVIILTAYGTIPQAVEAVKSGAYDFLTKPFDNDDLVETVRKALREHALTEALRDGESPPGLDHPLHRTMGASKHVSWVAQQVDRVADTNLTVLISGESGAGKELVARALHERSRRAASKFVALDCGSLPQGLVENELFGHQDGAYTGAGRARGGRFEAASGGTLFLDEIGDLPLSAQATLLRVLQDKTVSRVGGGEPIPVDVRVIAATNRNIRALVLEDTFRLDLYHRLAEFELHVVPLRDRKEDIPFLVRQFLDYANRENGRNVNDISQDVLSVLQAYDWPGNVRELRNVIRRAVILAEGNIKPMHLRIPTMEQRRDFGSAELRGAVEGALPLKEVARRSTREAERQQIEKVLRHTGGNKAKAARILQVDYKTLHTKVKEYGIEV